MASNLISGAVSVPRAIEAGAPASVTETTRRLVTQLAYQHKLPPVLAITSAVPGEGVSHTAQAIAATLAADLSASVCIVDLNWWAAEGYFAQLSRRARRRAPAAPAPLGPGIAAVLSGNIGLDAALLDSGTPQLTLLPAGELTAARRAAVARSAELKELLADLRTRYAYLVLDLPPVLQSSDAVALAALADGCCLVVRHGHTPADQVKRALDDIQHLPILGVILNRARVRTPRWLRAFLTNE